METEDKTLETITSADMSKYQMEDPAISEVLSLKEKYSEHLPEQIKKKKTSNVK